MIFLLDTDTLIYMIRGLKITAPRGESQRHRSHLANRILSHCRKSNEAGHEVGLFCITVAKLEYGARHSGDYSTEIAAVRKILAPFMTYDFDAGVCAEHYGEVRHALETSGGTIGAMDLLTGAHARALNAILVTNNSGHFGRIRGLRIENWTE